jgi:hypothetical protein
VEISTQRGGGQELIYQYRYGALLVSSFKTVCMHKIGLRYIEILFMHLM